VYAGSYYEHAGYNGRGRSRVIQECFSGTRGGLMLFLRLSLLAFTHHDFEISYRGGVRIVSAA